MPATPTVPHAPSMLVARSIDDEVAHEIIEFLIELTRALHASGTPAHRLEEAVEACARTLGMPGQCLASPGAARLAFGRGARQRLAIVRVPEARVHLERLVEADIIADRVASGELHPHEGLRELDMLVMRTERYPQWLVAIGYGVVGAAAARLFGGGVADTVLASAIGVLTGVVVLAAGSSRRFARLIEAASGVIAGFLGLVAAAHVPPISSFVVTISGLLMVMPGLATTVAVNELATRNLNAGTARAMGAIVSFVSIGFGVAIGRRVAQAVNELVTAGAAERVADAAAMAGWTIGLALVAAAAGFTVVFRARPRDFFATAVAGVLGYVGGELGAHAFGRELGVCVGAFFIGLVGLLYARRFKRPAVVPTLPGIMVLVPGSIGFHGVQALIDHNVESGVQAVFAVVIVAVSLAAGLLLANATLPPRRAL